MVQEFVILTVEADLSQKKIIVTTNNKIDPNSIDTTVIEVMERETRTKVMFTTEIIDNVLEVTLSEWPQPNSSYIFYLKTLKNILGENVRAGIRRKIEFKSSIVEEVEILSPSMHETVKALDVKYAIKNNTDITSNINSYVHIEVANDNTFNNIAESVNVLDKDKSNVLITLKRSGQYFLRARLESNDSDTFQYSKWTNFISFIYGQEEAYDEVEEDLPNDYLPDYEDMSPVIDMIVDFEIDSNIVQGQTPKNILLIANKGLDEDKFNQAQILISGRNGFIRHHAIVDGNEIEIELLDELKDNSTYTLRLNEITNIYGETLSKEIKIMTRMKPMYCEINAVTSLIGEYKIPDDVILYHIREASKFADYVASTEGNFIDEDDVPFSVEQLVKYYAAHECLLRHTVDLSSNVGISGTVGNVTFSERETTKDISKLLNHFCEEKDKWKNVMSGYGGEGRARMRTTIRGRYASPMIQPLGLNSTSTYGRGDLYGK